MAKDFKLLKHERSAKDDSLSAYCTFCVSPRLDTQDLTSHWLLNL